MKRVVVLGGGISGIESAIFLRRLKYQVTLVSDRDYLYIYPLSIWIPTGAVNQSQISLPLEALAKAHGFEVVVSPVERIDAAAQRVTTTSTTLEYDYLVVAFGADKVNHPGREHFLSICGCPEEALQLKDRFAELVSRGTGKIAVGFGGNPKDKSGVRGGPAFEVLFNFDTYLRRRRLRDKFELTFFAPMPRPGERLGEKALGAMDYMLKRLDIEKRVGKKIERFTNTGILLEDNTVLPSDLTMFIPANSGKKELVNSDLPVTEAGFIRIDDHCRVEGFDNVFAVGDVAAIEGPSWKAKQGHLAEVMARAAAFNLHALETGKKLRHGYQSHMNIICLMDTGNGAAFVHRNDKRGLILPMPIFGHWLKQAWGMYYKLSKMRRIPRIPGL